MVDENRPKRETNDSKQPSKASKTQKAAFSKNIKKPLYSFFNVFDIKGLSRKPQEAEEGSQKAPKKSKIPKNRNPKLSPKIIEYWNQFFGAHSETQAQPK